MIVECNRLEKTLYKNVINNENAIYCEIRYTRDRSSFAGIAFEIKDKFGISCLDIKEREFKKVNKYERLYIGMDKKYYKSLVEIYDAKRLHIGIHILFLVYSDVRSSQMAFKYLMEWLSNNIQQVISDYKIAISNSSDDRNSNLREIDYGME